jgi:hypothetical protein
MISRLREATGNPRIGGWFELAVRRLEANEKLQARLPAQLAALPRETSRRRAQVVPRVRSRHGVKLDPPGPAGERHTATASAGSPKGGVEL